MTAKNQATIFRSLVIIEKHPCLRTIKWLLFTVHDNSWQPCMIRDHHSQSSIGFDHIDAVNRYLVETADLRRGDSAQQQHSNHAAQNDGINHKKPLPGSCHKSSF